MPDCVEKMAELKRALESPRIEEIERFELQSNFSAPDTELVVYRNLGEVASGRKCSGNKPQTDLRYVDFSRMQFEQTKKWPHQTMRPFFIPPNRVFSIL